jgi:hypothetical protein
VHYISQPAIVMTPCTVARWIENANGQRRESIGRMGDTSCVVRPSPARLAPAELLPQRRRRRSKYSLAPGHGRRNGAPTYAGQPPAGKGVRRSLITPAGKAPEGTAFCLLIPSSMIINWGKPGPACFWQSVEGIEWRAERPASVAGPSMFR